MKRVFALLLTLILCLGCLPAAFAAEPEYEIIHETTEYLPDGTKVTVTLSVQPVRTRGRVYTVNGKKDYTYGSDWTFTVYGSFSVNEGVSVSCTSDSYGSSIFNSAWTRASGTSGHSGATATASGTMTRYYGGAPVQTVYPSVSVSCDKYDNLS